MVKSFGLPFSSVLFKCFCCQTVQHAYTHAYPYVSVFSSRDMHAYSLSCTFKRKVGLAWKVHNQIRGINLKVKQQVKNSSKKNIFYSKIATNPAVIKGIIHSECLYFTDDSWISETNWIEHCSCACLSLGFFHLYFTPQVWQWPLRFKQEIYMAI